jgi:DNA topoisomerase III
VALIAAYNDMGLTLSKPNLRAAMEADMKKISQRAKTKNIVVNEQVNMYKAVFQEVVQKAQSMDRAVAQYFDKKGTSFDVQAQQFTTCGLCKSGMDLRTHSNV